MLAEATTTEISKEKKPKTITENRMIARQGGTIAGNTRKEIEAKTGKKVISQLNAKSDKSLEEAKKKEYRSTSKNGWPQIIRVKTIIMSGRCIKNPERKYAPDSFYIAAVYSCKRAVLAISCTMTPCSVRS